MTDKNWREVVELADHFIAIDHTRVYLRDTANLDYPWDYVSSVRPGGTHRYDMTTSVSFGANHPCGIDFHWTFDIEPWKANGSDSYQIDKEGVLKVLASLPSQQKEAFRTYLGECAVHVKRQGDLRLAAAAKQIDDAKILFMLAQP